MTAKQLLLVLRARSRLLVIVFLTVLTLGLLITLVWPDTYVAQASVVVDSLGTDVISGAQQSAELVSNNLETQMEVIGSHNVALKVVEKLNLDANQYFRHAYFSATNGKGPIKDWIADRLLTKNLDVHPSNAQPTKQSNIIQVDVSARDPVLAADMANAFANAYVQTHLELKLEPARRQAGWFDAQLDTLRNALESAQKRLSDYQAANSVVGTDSKVDVENARLVDISTRLTAAQTAMADSQTRLKQINDAVQQGKLLEVPDIADNELLQNLKASLVAAQAKLAETSERFGKNHPEFVSASAQVNELERKLLAEVNIAKGSVSQAAQISARQEAELKAALEQQRDRVLALKRQQDGQDVLKSGVENAQRAYDAGVQRANQVHMESRLDQSNIAVLNPAIPPIKAARPKPLLNAVITIFLAIFLSMAAAVFLEIIDPRLRSRIDIVNTLGIPVLAEVVHEVGKLKQPKLLGRLSPARLSRAGAG